MLRILSQTKSPLRCVLLQHSVIRHRLKTDSLASRRVTEIVVKTSPIWVMSARWSSTPTTKVPATPRKTKSSLKHYALCAVALTGGFVAHCVHSDLVQNSNRREVFDEKKNNFKRSVVGGYENRIRAFSAPEKVFEYFASVVISGEAFMTPSDFIRSITPFANGESEDLGSKNFKFSWKARHLGASPQNVAEYQNALATFWSSRSTKDGESLCTKREVLGITAQQHFDILESNSIDNKAFMSAITKAGVPQSKFIELVDTNGDGLISFGEYIFFTTVISLPKSQFHLAFKIFDLDRTGELSQSEFEQMMHVLQHSTHLGRAVRARRTLFKKRNDCGTLPATDTNFGVMARFFGSDGKRRLCKADFLEFVEKLKLEVARLEFQHHDVDGQGILSGHEFARFLIEQVDKNQRVNYMDKLALFSKEYGKDDPKIYYKDFADFQVFMQHLPEMECAMKTLQAGSGDGLTKEQFRIAANAAVEGNLTLTDDIITIVFNIFDVKNDDHMSVEEFIDVMTQRKERNINQIRGLGVFQFLDRSVTCASRVLR